MEPTIPEIAECITAGIAIVGIILAFVWRQYDLDRKRKGILVEFALSTYFLDQYKHNLLQKWHQIEVHWNSKKTITAIAALREAIKKFHASGKYVTGPRSNADGISEYHWQTPLNVYSSKNRALREVNEMRTKLCQQMCKDMWFLKPNLNEIIPFEAIIKNPL